MTASRPWLGISPADWLIKSDTPHGREQVAEQPVRKHLPALLSQKRIHTARGHQMTHQRHGVQQLPVTTRTTLHPPIIDQTRSQPAHRHAHYSAQS
jgi:hypothetical protein